MPSQSRKLKKQAQLSFFFFFLQDDVNECSVILPSLGHGNSLRDIVQ